MQRFLIVNARPYDVASKEAALQDRRGGLKRLILATIYHLSDNTHGAFLRFFECNLEPKLTLPGGSILATFVSENHPNTFPALPIREGVNVFVSFSHFADRGSYQQHVAIFTNSISGNGVAEKLSTLIKGRAEVLLLAPTPRSLLR